MHSSIIAALVVAGCTFVSGFAEPNGATNPATAGFAVVKPESVQGAQVGKDLTIEWSTDKLPDESIFIVLYSGCNGSSLTRATDIGKDGHITPDKVKVSEGKFKWTIPASVGTDVTYGLMLRTSDEADATYQWSNPFSIAFPAPTSAKCPAAPTTSNEPTLTAIPKPSGADEHSGSSTTAASTTSSHKDGAGAGAQVDKSTTTKADATATSSSKNGTTSTSMPAGSHTGDGASSSDGSPSSAGTTSGGVPQSTGGYMSTTTGKADPSKPGSSLAVQGNTASGIFVSSGFVVFAGLFALFAL